MNNTQKEDNKKMGLFSIITWNADLVIQVNIVGTVLEDMQDSMQDYLASYPIAPPLPRIRINDEDQDEGTPYNVSLIIEVTLQTLIDRIQDVSYADWETYCTLYEGSRNAVDSPDTTRKAYFSESALLSIDRIGDYIDSHDLPPARQGMRWKSARGYNRRLITFMAIYHAVAAIKHWNKKSGAK